MGLRLGFSQLLISGGYWFCIMYLHAGFYLPFTLSNVWHWPSISGFYWNEYVLIFFKIRLLITSKTLYDVSESCWSLRVYFWVTTC